MLFKIQFCKTNITKELYWFCNYGFTSRKTIYIYILRLVGHVLVAVRIAVLLATASDAEEHRGHERLAMRAPSSIRGIL